MAHSTHSEDSLIINPASPPLPASPTTTATTATKTLRHRQYGGSSGGGGGCGSGGGGGGGGGMGSGEELKHVTTRDLFSPLELERLFQKQQHRETDDKGKPDDHTPNSDCPPAPRTREGDKPRSESHLSSVPSTARFLKLTSLTPRTPLSRFQSLVSLDVSDSKLTTLEAIRELKGLEELRFDRNGVQGCGVVPAGLRRLKRVSGRWNAIGSLEGLGWRPLLTELDLSFNFVSHLSNLSHSLPALEHLTLDNNQISVIHLAHPLPSLITLSLVNNRLSIYNNIYTPSLRTLVLDGNRLYAVDLSYSSKKQGMTLSARNQAHDNFYLGISSLGAVAELDLSTNALGSKLRLPAPLPDLMHLNLSQCALSSLPDSFQNFLPSLQTLDLSYNSLDESTLPHLSALTALQSLDIRGNKFSQVELLIAMLQGCVSVKEVDLRENEWEMRAYARLVIESLPALSALDGAPVERESQGLTVEHGGNNTIKVGG